MISVSMANTRDPEAVVQLAKLVAPMVGGGVAVPVNPQPLLQLSMRVGRRLDL